MTLTPSAQAEAERLGRSLAPPTAEEGALMAVIWVPERAEEARAS